MKKYVENIIPVVVIVLLILGFAMLVGSKVHAQNVEEARREQREAMESIYISNVRERLAEKGFCNSGVNMTKETNEAGEWEYTVIIYNHSFAWMEEATKADFERELADMGSSNLGKISLSLLAR